MSANTEVKSTDMDQKMLEIAIRVATAAFNKFPDSQTEVANFVKTEFDSRYGPNWHCIVGRNYVAKVTHTTKSFAYFCHGPSALLLWKSGG
mmetsp:Transcript_26518/g.36957  ORF Transcript_26518/g.36957 Transcript_26518/m.36957 type:complete len:91 (-) Transcript_26518:249-521(-)